MDAALLERIKKTSAARKSREENKNYVLAHPETLGGLVWFAFNSADKDSHKACWILEFVAHQEPNWLRPHCAFICNNLRVLKEESAIRPIAKVCQLLASEHFNAKSPIELAEEQLHQLIEACFDWLITDVKVAPKAYSMRALFVLGQKFDWIYPELRTILEKDYQHHSAAYKSAAKEILKKMP